MVADEILATAAAAELGLVRSDVRPMVAAHLLACGHDGTDLLALACLSNRSSGWQVDHLVPGTLRDIGAPDLSVEAAGEIVARLLAQDAPAISDYPLVRTLARLAPELDYPSGVIGRAYALDEWLDCDCHRDSPERAQAEAFEHEIRSLPHLNLPPPLAAALTGRHGQ